MRLPFPRKRSSNSADGVTYQVVEVIGASGQNLDEAVQFAAQRIAERAKTPRQWWPRPDLVGIALAGAGAAGAFAAAKRLLDRDPTELGFQNRSTTPRRTRRASCDRLARR